MSWWGKLIGGALGFSLGGGPLGALIGAYLGHRFVDKNSAQSFKSIELTQAAFFTASFSVMGHIAKADGRVSKDEIEMAQQVMAHMNLNAEQKRLAIDLFNQGKRDDFDLDGVMRQFKMAAKRRSTLYQMFIEIQLHAIYADGTKSTEEDRILQRLANILGFSRLQLNHLESMISGNLSGPDNGPFPGQSPANQLEQAYALLGVNNTASDNEVKKAYRRMMSQHHPDKLVSKGLPEEMIKLANEKTQQIKKAYELIKSRRAVS